VKVPNPFFKRAYLALSRQGDQGKRVLKVPDKALPEMGVALSRQASPRGCLQPLLPPVMSPPRPAPRPRRCSPSARRPSGQGVPARFSCAKNTSCLPGKFGRSMPAMWKVLRRRWKYLTAKLSGRWEETADPKVQLEQAIAEAQDQHRRLVEQAANVIANQKQTELQLNRAMQELERLSGTTRQALAMANDAANRGDAAKAAELNQTAEALANRLIATEKRVEDLKTMHLQATQAAQQAKAAVQQNAIALQAKLTERQKLLSQLDQARMQEQLNAAMASLSQTVGQDVPTFDDVRAKIEAQYAKALGISELAGQNMEARMLEIEQAGVNVEAQQRLDQMRAEMGLPLGPTAQQAALGAGATPSAQQALSAGRDGEAAAEVAGNQPSETAGVGQASAPQASAPQQAGQPAAPARQTVSQPPGQPAAPEPAGRPAASPDEG
jgi:phage shock protein A